jgi:hypothetical protein
MPVREQIFDTRVQDQDGDARNVINARWKGNAEARELRATTLGGADTMTVVRIAH